MAELIRSGQVADLVLLCLALEAAGLAAWRWRTGRGLSMSAMAALVMPGVMLALALRAALMDAWWGWVGLSLAGALLAHVADLHQRLRVRPGAGAHQGDWPADWRPPPDVNDARQACKLELTLHGVRRSMACNEDARSDQARPVGPAGTGGPPP